jgi:multidrug efflux pump subunit AcrA (membrane-fusion protein)
MFAQVSVPVHQAEKVLIVPSSAIATTLYGSYLFVIEPSKQGGFKALQFPVTVSSSIGNDVIVSGEKLKAGQQIVKMGAFKLRNGEAVRVLAENK